MEFDQKLLDYIGQSLVASGETISVAESVTSGCLQLAFSQMPNHSLFYKGGITAYNMEEKINLLDVSEKDAGECHGVSEMISEEMALNVAKLFGTDWSIATTGYCSPVRNSSYRIFTFFTVAYQGEILFTKKLELHHKTEALAAKMYYTEFILGCFKTSLTQQFTL